MIQAEDMIASRGWIIILNSVLSTDSDVGQVLDHDLSKKILKELAKLCGLKKMRATQYHPQTIGKVKRTNQTIILMLKTLPDLHKNKCKDHVKKLVLA